MVTDSILKFLEVNGICALSVVLPDGSIHSASMHFSHNNNPFELYFSTERSSRKCTGLLNGEVVKASVVVGVDDKMWKQLQISGDITMVSDSDELKRIMSIHYTKHKESEKYKDDPETVFLKFTPTWWKYTDFNTDQIIEETAK